MKRPSLRSFFIFLLLGTLYCTLVYGSAPPRTPFIQISENLWYGTNQGLFRYQSENDEVSDGWPVHAWKFIFQYDDIG